MILDDEDTQPNGPNLAERIRRLANGRMTLDVAQFQFIGLADVRARYAERWPERRERVHRVARDFIVKRIAGDDVLIPGADGFLVVFGACTGNDADAAAARIAGELNAFFVGTGDGDLQFRTQRSAMSVDDLARAFGDLIAEASEQHAGQQPVPVPKIVAAGKPAAFSRLMAMPMWDARKEVLGAHFLVPADAQGRPVEAPTDDRPGEAQRARLEFDEMKLRQSETALRKLFAAGHRGYVGVSLHVAGLNSMASLTRLFSIMSKFDKRLAPYRIVQIEGIEPGFPRIYLEDIVRTLKSRAPAVAIGAHWSEPDVASLLRVQPAAIGFNVGHDAFWPSGPRADFLSRVQAMCAAARPSGTPVFAHGEITPALAQRLVAEGVSLMASPDIWPLEPDPLPVLKWRAARFAQLQQAQAAPQPQPEPSAEADADVHLV
jgi:hypothetical protein